MGYTHYYGIKGARSEEWKEAWPKLIRDTQRIVDAADVRIVGPAGVEYSRYSKKVPPAIIDVKKGIKLNGLGEENGHESFLLYLKDQSEFCKTGRRPYDVVCCILLRAYTLVPEKFKLRSDGDWDEHEWKEARNFYHRLWPDEELECPQEMRDEDEEEDEEEGSEESQEDEEDEDYKP